MRAQFKICLVRAYHIFSHNPELLPFEDGIDNFHVLKNFKGREFYDPKTITVWRYSAETGIFWGFDDARTVRMKAQYAHTKAGGLGGVMFWDLSGDDAAGTLINATKSTGNRPK